MDSYYFEGLRDTVDHDLIKAGLLLFNRGSYTEHGTDEYSRLEVLSETGVSIITNPEHIRAFIGVLIGSTKINSEVISYVVRPDSVAFSRYKSGKLYLNDLKQPYYTLYVLKYAMPWIYDMLPHIDKTWGLGDLNDVLENKIHPYDVAQDLNLSSSFDSESDEEL